MAEPSDFYFLGGRDLEMAEIAKLLAEHAPGRVHDKQLAWGARLSAYRAELMRAVAAGETPVLVELEDDLPPDAFDRACSVVVIDHHGSRAGQDRPTSIEQVFVRLGLPAKAWTRRLALVAANDRGHIAGMREIGASREEMTAIRAEDRATQGVSATDEVEAVRAMASRRMRGRAAWVETTSNTSSAIADRMHADVGGPGYERLIVVMPGKVAAFGDGTMIEALRLAFPGSYWGGDLPRAGFWGMDLPGKAERQQTLERIAGIAGDEHAIVGDSNRRRQL